MKTLFKMLAGALLSALFLSINSEVNAQTTTWNVPASGSNYAVGNFIGTTGTSLSGDLILKTAGTERMRILGTGQTGATGQVGIGCVPIASTPSGPYYFLGPQLQVAGSINNSVPAWSPASIFRISGIGTSAGPLDFGFTGSASTQGPLITSTSPLILSFPQVKVVCKMTVGDQLGSSGITSMATPAGYSLYVAQGILTEKVKIAIQGTGNWSDFVFAKNYKLPSLIQVEQYIAKNHHLSGIPSAKEVVKDGVDLGQMDAKLLMKVEELTLYTIDQNKEIIDQNKEIDALKKQNTEILKVVVELKSLVQSKK